MNGESEPVTPTVYISYGGTTSVKVNAPLGPENTAGFPTTRTATPDSPPRTVPATVMALAVTEIVTLAWRPAPTPTIVTSLGFPGGVPTATLIRTELELLPAGTVLVSNVAVIPAG